MMKLAGYSLAVSFAPISSNVVKSNGRFTLGISHRNTCSYRLFSTHAQKQQLQEKPGVVARYYLPPWFRSVPGISALRFFFFVLMSGSHFSSACTIKYTDFFSGLVLFLVG